MISAWTKHLKTPEEIERFSKFVQGSKLILERLRDIIQEDVNNLDSQEGTFKDFDVPNWDYKQAFRNGQRSTLKNIQRLLTIDPGRDTR